MAVASAKLSSPTYAMVVPKPLAYRYFSNPDATASMVRKSVFDSTNPTVSDLRVRRMRAFADGT